MVSHWRIICRNDFLDEIHDHVLFDGTLVEAQNRASEIWNERYGHMADRGNSIHVIDAGGETVFSIFDYADDEVQPNAEIDKLRMYERTHIENLDKLRSDLEREKASNLDLRNKLEEARAAAPHFYHPSTMHMGDCSICGGTADAPQHDVAQWEVRCKFAEATIAAIKEAIQ